MKRALLAMLGGGLVAAMIVFQATAGVASPANRGASAAGVFMRAGNNHAPSHVVGHLASPLAGTHYVYAEDGTCPDGIDVYQVTGTTLTHIQNVSVGCSIGMYFGAHLLEVAGSGHCLIMSDGGDADVLSFTIASNGMLSTSPVSTVSVGGFPMDLNQIGNTIIESNSNANNATPTLDTLALGSGCTLTLLHQNSTGAQDDVNIAVKGNFVLTSDFNSTGTFVYKLGSGGTLTQVYSTASQIANPDGAAIYNNAFYTGQATFSPPQAQGYGISSSGLTPLSGSPVTDGNPSSSNGAAVAAAGGLIVQAETFSSNIAWYSPNPMSYGGDTPLQVAGDDATSLTVVGSNILVAQAYGGDLEACHAGSSGVSNCHTVATLTGAGSGASGSSAVK